ncbi:hypothetical protein GCM10020295_70950 [Streptomyces cinereospinus]
MDQVHDLTFPGPDGPLPVRVYRPAGQGPLPVLVYFFGGGWTLGSLDTGDALCRNLTNAVGCLTVAVGYRLAPPNTSSRRPPQDCFAGVRWVAEHAGEFGGDPSRLAVAGGQRRRQPGRRRDPHGP